MSETEIDLAKQYLSAAGQDPVAALIRSVRDLARANRLLAGSIVVELHPARDRVRAREAAAAVELA